MFGGGEASREIYCGGRLANPSFLICNRDDSRQLAPNSRKVSRKRNAMQLVSRGTWQALWNSRPNVPRGTETRQSRAFVCVPRGTICDASRLTFKRRRFSGAECSMWNFYSLEISARRPVLQTNHLACSTWNLPGGEKSTIRDKCPHRAERFTSNESSSREWSSRSGRSQHLKLDMPQETSRPICSTWNDFAKPLPARAQNPQGLRDSTNGRRSPKGQWVNFRVV